MVEPNSGVQVPLAENQVTRSHRAKLAERQKIFDCMKGLQLTKLNRWRR